MLRLIKCNLHKLDSKNGNSISIKHVIEVRATELEKADVESALCCLIV